MRKLIGLSLVIIAAVFMTMAFMPEEAHSGYHVGDVVDDFLLMDTEKNMVSLDSYGDVEGWIVTYTCNTCPYAVMYEDRLIDLHNRHASKGFPVVAINPNDPEVKAGDSFEEMVTRSEEKKFPFKYLFDKGQEVYPKWGATKTPHIFLVSNNDGKKVLEYIGAIDDSPRDATAVTVNYVDKAIEAIKSGKKPDPDTTKAIGCSIKTKSKSATTTKMKKRKS